MKVARFLSLVASFVLPLFAAEPVGTVTIYRTSDMQCGLTEPVLADEILAAKELQRTHPLLEKYIKAMNLVVEPLQGGVDER